jgi:uncharacterized membrane protein HdeD (DUF308 family)
VPPGCWWLSLVAGIGLLAYVISQGSPFAANGTVTIYDAIIFLFVGIAGIVRSIFRGDSSLWGRRK